jgi:hypothetical protein
MAAPTSRPELASSPSTRASITAYPPSSGYQIPTVNGRKPDKTDAGEHGGLREIEDHIVVCGLGNIGYRVVEELDRLEVPVVAVELDPGNRFVSAVRRWVSRSRPATPACERRSRR